LFNQFLSNQKMQKIQQQLKKKNKRVEILIQLRQFDFKSKLRDWIMEFCSDEEVMMAAVCCDGSLLRFGSSQVQNNKKIVLNAVSGSGDSLVHSSDLLRNDEEIVSAAVTNCGKSLQFASEDLRKNKKIVLLAVAKDCKAFEFIMNDALKEDKEVLMAKNRLYYLLLTSNEKIMKFSDISFKIK
jgi:hypothetical protein